MKWDVLGVCITLTATPMLISSPPLSPTYVGILSLGALLLLDWAWTQVLGSAAWGIENRENELRADFSDHKNARWRYMFAIIVSGALAFLFSLGGSERFQAGFLVGGYAIFVAVAFVSTLRARRRVMRRR